MPLATRGLYILSSALVFLLISQEKAFCQTLLPHYYLTVTAQNANTGKKLEIRVKIKDVEWNKLVGSVKTNFGGGPQKNYTRIEGGRKYQLILKKPGYADQAFELDLTQPSTLQQQDFNPSDSTLAITVQMKRPPDKSNFPYYHIYFWDNSTVLLKEPKKELRDLLSLMRELPEVEITIIGHVDGERFLKYTQVREEKGEVKVFSLSGRNPEKTASAKNFSEERANTVKHYLVQNGIAPERIEVDGKGRRYAEYDLSEAYKNNRIEIALKR